MPPSALRIHLALLTVSVLFGANYVVTKRILVDMVPVAWVLVRIAAATAILLPLLLFCRRSRPWPAPRQLLPLLGAAFFGVALNQVLFTEGMARTTPEHSAVVNACIPTWTLLVAALCRQERLDGRRLLAILLALLGVQYLLGLDRLLLGTAPANGEASLLGDLLTMLNGLSFAIHLVWMRRLSRSIDPYLATAVMFASATCMIGLWSGPQLQPGQLVAVLQPATFWYAAYAILFATLLTYMLNTWALRYTRSSAVALYINVQPLVAAALHWLLGAPAPDHRFYVALLLVALGLWLQTGRS